MKDNKIMAENIKSKREKLKLSQSQLGNLVGMTYVSIHNLEREALPIRKVIYHGIKDIMNIYEAGDYHKLWPSLDLGFNEYKNKMEKRGKKK